MNTIYITIIDQENSNGALVAVFATRKLQKEFEAWWLLDWAKKAGYDLEINGATIETVEDQVFAAKMHFEGSYGGMIIENVAHVIDSKDKFASLK